MRIPINLAACIIAANNADVVRRVVIETHDGDHYAATNEPGLDSLADEPDIDTADEPDIDTADEPDIDTADEPTDYDKRFDALNLAVDAAPPAEHPTEHPTVTTKRAEEFYRWLTQA